MVTVLCHLCMGTTLSCGMPCCLVYLCLMKKYQKAKDSTATAATPPTTPPTMGPGLDGPGVGDGTAGVATSPEEEDPWPDAAVGFDETEVEV